MMIAAFEITTLYGVAQKCAIFWGHPVVG